MTKRTVTAFAFIACVAAGVGANSLTAQSGIPGSVAVERVQAGTYALDPSHTQVSWQVSHFGFNDYFGLFGDIEGIMTLDPAQVEDAAFDITVPITSVAVSSAGLRDHLLRGGTDGGAPDFFGPDPEPARFVSTSVRQTSSTTAVVSGQLTMNGNSGPVTMLVTFTGAGQNPMNQKDTVGFHARARIDRTQWGIDYAAPAIGADVDLTISAAFERQ